MIHEQRLVHRDIKPTNIMVSLKEAMASVEDRPRDLVIRTQLGEGSEIRVMVRDSGIGLDPFNAERILMRSIRQAWRFGYGFIDQPFYY